MELATAIKRRRSVRRFLPDPVPEADIERMVSLAQLAPSASNQQMWRFVAVSNRPMLERMKQAISDRYDRLAAMVGEEEHRVALRQAKGYSTLFAEAPVTIAVLGEPYRSGLDGALQALGVPAAELGARRGWPDIQSIGAAVEHLLLAAAEMGYGTCWMTGPQVAREALEQLVGAEPPWRLLALVPVGKPAMPPAPHGPRREGSGLTWIR